MLVINQSTEKHSAAFLLKLSRDWFGDVLKTKTIEHFSLNICCF